MLKILIIGAVWPEPASSGAGLRIMQYIKLFLQQQWAITVASTAAPTEHMADLKTLSIQTAAIAVNDSRFDTFIANLMPDIVLFDRFTMEEQFGWRVEKNCPQALRIIETIDLHCLRQARHTQFKRTRDVAQYVDQNDLFNASAVREIAAIYRSDLSILTSTYEVQLLQDRFHMPDHIIHLCPFMFDNNTFNAERSAASPAFGQRADFISIGNFRHAPNWDAVLWLKQDIWPIIRAAIPTAELHVYGAYAPAKAFALHQPASGFHVLGRADDIDVVMQQSRVCLAPLRFGAGIKTKLADAMRNGTPSVTTDIGAEGMHTDPVWCGAIENDATALAEAAIHLYQHQSSWQAAQQQGFDMMQQFDAVRLGNALIHRIQSCRATLASHRLNNFYGSMLRHHQHRSTEFMSRWIEAKDSAKDST